MLHQRILMQKMVQGAKRLPDASLLNKFGDHSAQLSTNMSTCRRNLKSHIKELQAIQKGMFKVAELKINLNYPVDENDEALEMMETDLLWK